MEANNKIKITTKERNSISRMKRDRRKPKTNPKKNKL